MIRAVLLTLEKEFRLLWRDRVGIFMLLVAPIAVIGAAGLSLANIYGSNPAPDTRYVIALVDEDREQVGAAVIDGLAKEKSILTVRAADRATARAMVRETKQALAAVVVPPGTTRRLREGKDAQLAVYTDPVRYLETVRTEVRLGELCRAITANAVAEARRRLDVTRAKISAELKTAAESARKVRADLEGLERQAGQRRAAAQLEIQKKIESAIAQARQESQQSLSHAVDQIAIEIAERAKTREAALKPLKRYVEQLKAAQVEFQRWFEQLKQIAGGHAADIPPPPAFPQPPATDALSLENDAGLDVAALKARLAAQMKPPPLHVAIPELPAPPKLPPIPEVKLDERPGKLVLPGSLGFSEQNLAGEKVNALEGFNVFDLHVPGFGVTFLLIGMLMGVSLALIDEREWGTLERLRSASAPLAATLAGKFLSRFIIGFAQLIVLFAAGYVLFGISLGRAPLALLMPGASIAFAGAAFGLVVAGIARTRDAVLPVGAIVIMTMAAVGGCWWPIDFEPAWMRAVALAMPTTWTMQAFNDLMIRRLPAVAAVVPSVINLGFGVLYTLIGIPLARRRFS